MFEENIINEEIISEELVSNYADDYKMAYESIVVPQSIKDKKIDIEILNFINSLEKTEYLLAKLYLFSTCLKNDKILHLKANVIFKNILLISTWFFILLYNCLN